MAAYGSQLVAGSAATWLELADVRTTYVPGCLLRDDTSTEHVVVV
jgi:hypothetical protein